MDKKIGFTIIAVAITSFYIGNISQPRLSADKVKLNGKGAIKKQSVNESIKPVYEMPSKNSTAFESILKNKDKEISTLTHQLSKSKEQYQQRIDDLSLQLSELQELAYTPQSTQQKTRDIPLTKEEVERHLSAPFSALMIGSNKKTKELFNTLHGDKVNEQWAYSITNQINDFIQMHEYSNQLTSYNTKCNDTTCQISGIEMQPDIWAKIEVDLKAQDWWEFDFLRSASSENKDNIRYFYILAGDNS